MSLCNKCYAPGSCCKKIGLLRRSDDGGTEYRTHWADGGLDGVTKQVQDSGLPFVAVKQTSGLYTDDETGRPYATYEFSCPKLGDNGRCTIYRNRPEICRIYEPLSDGLCVHFGGAEGVDLSASDALA